MIVDNMWKAEKQKKTARLMAGARLKMVLRRCQRAYSH